MELKHYRLDNGCEVYEVKRPSTNSITEERYDSLFVTAKNMEEAVSLATKVGFVNEQDEIKIARVYASFPEFILPGDVEGKPISESLEDKTKA